MKFFSSAGFPLDVATKHAVVFSNNRIKPDMLPDLDKPSLKEMGITLMGDMIAILRYAKKVSEEMTCEKFLVDTKEVSPPERVLKMVKPVVKKPLVISKQSVSKASPARPLTKSIVKEPAKSTRIVSSSVTVGSAQKKRIVTGELPRIPQQDPAKKRKIVTKIMEIDSDSQEEWAAQMQKRLKVSSGNGTAGYKVITPRAPAKPAEASKKSFEQKRTVFDRLGDSSVTSTTSSTDSSTTFNITGLGDVLKRNSSVFNRLGDKDRKKEEKSAGILKNGNAGSNGQLQGILKSRASNIRATTVKLKSASTGRIATGTMHADHERSKIGASTSVRQLVKTTKTMKLNSPQRIVERKINIESKLGEILFVIGFIR